MSADPNPWGEGDPSAEPEGGEFMTAIQKVHRETTACQNALNRAYAVYQSEHDRILRAYWSAMQSITIGADSPETTQVVPAIDWAQQGV